MLYNEIDPFAAEWLANLMRAGELPMGRIDQRSIAELKGSDCALTTHLFAGIGGWPLALRLAGWPDDKPVWTGSCPCQPFSSAGKRKGISDERHLWPEMRRLITGCRPATVFGEQVASKDGREWVAGIRADLEELGYEVGIADLCAAGTAAPHIRQRLFWVADSRRERNERRRKAGNVSGEASDAKGEAWERQRSGYAFGDCERISGLEYAQGDRRNEWRTESNRRGFAGGCAANGLGVAKGELGNGRQHFAERRQEGRIIDRGSCAGERGNERMVNSTSAERWPDSWHGESERQTTVKSGNGNPWSEYRIVNCKDKKSRRIGRGVFPLADGIPQQLRPLFAWLGGMGIDASPLTKMARLARRNRTGRLRGYGNAIVPQLAGVFIQTFMEWEKS